MSEFWRNASYFAVALTLIGYFFGLWVKKKVSFVLFNPLLIAIVFVIAILKIIGMDYETYKEGGKYIGYFLTPATICLAVPLYKQFDLLKEHYKSVLVAIFAGVLVNMGVILGLAIFFSFNHQLYVTMLPKSITTAIAVGLTEELGGITTITVAAIIVTGIIGNVFASALCKVFKITESIAVGLAIGTSSHALGTAKAVEIGEVEGAMSGLAIAVTGLMTVVMVNVFAGLIV